MAAELCGKSCNCKSIGPANENLKNTPKNTILKIQF